jgi:hypothetical protein
VPTTHPQYDVMGCELMVGTLRFVHPTDSAGVAYLTARWRIDGIFSAESWRRRFSRNGSSPRIRREKNIRLAARKIARIPVAFSLPQDSLVELMFGAARFGEPALSTSRGLGFHIVPRVGRSPHRLDNPRKCFNQ